MTSHSTSLDAVLRLPEVTLSREKLEAVLGIGVNRFEATKSGGTFYAQVNLPEGSSWDSATTLFERIGPALQLSMQQGRIGRPRFDAALYIAEGFVSASIVVPNAAAAVLGRFGIDLEVSGYLAGPD